jgi:hypothetical protein
MGWLVQYHMSCERADREEWMAHPAVLIDAHEAGIYAQTSENECAGDYDE